MKRAYVENKKPLRGKSKISTWESSQQLLPTPLEPLAPPKSLTSNLFFLYLCDTHGDEMTHDEQLQMDALYRNALRLIEQRDALLQEMETQRREIADLKARLSEQCDELEGLESRNRQLLMARALIVSGTDMGIAKERLSQMIKRMDQSIALLELQHSTATTQSH